MPTSLHQIVALTYVYRRMVTVCCALPAATLVFPAASWVTLGLLRQCTDYGVLAVLLTLFLMAAARNQIHRLVTSKEALEVSLQNNQVRLPLLMFIVSCGISRVLGPILDRLGLSTMLRLTTGMGISTALRLCVSMSLLGMLVAARFVGPTSISTLLALSGCLHSSVIVASNTAPGVCSDSHLTSF